MYSTELCSINQTRLNDFLVNKTISCRQEDLLSCTTYDTCHTRSKVDENCSSLPAPLSLGSSNLSSIPVEAHLILMHEEIVPLVSWHYPEHLFNGMIRQYSYACVATAYYSIILIHKEIADRTLLREENSPLQSHIVI